MSLVYYAPSTLSDALTYLDRHSGVKIIAGGTDLLIRHYERLDCLEGIMDIGKIPALTQVETGETVRIGALATHQVIGDHPWLQRHTPVLCQGALEVGAPQIRNRGTLGGNLANASPAADTAPPLMVLGAQVELSGPGQRRSVPIEEFFTGPGRTVLQPNQLITAVTFPAPKPNQGGAYIKLGKRKAMAIATVSIALQVTVLDNKLSDLRICMGSVAPIPLRAVKTEAVLRGQDLSSLPLQEAAAQLRAEITPIDDIRGTAAYRRQAAGTIFRRALLQAIGNAGVELDG